MDIEHRRNTPVSMFGASPFALSRRAAGRSFLGNGDNPLGDLNALEPHTRDNDKSAQQFLTPKS